MGRRFSGNPGGGAAGGAGARAIAASQQVPLRNGPLFTLTWPNLLQPMSFGKTGGSPNLSVDAASGAVSAAAALIGGASQAIAGTVSGADGVTVPFAVTLTGAVSAPAAPMLTGTPAPGQVTLSWVEGADNGAAITQHTLYRGTSAGGEVAIGTPSASPYIDGGLSNGTRYYYRLSASNGIGEGAPSAEIAVTPAAVPAAPAMTLTPAAGQVTIAWTDGAANGSAITAHKLYRGTSAGGEVLVGTISSASPYVDGGRTAGQTYYYRLSAVNGVGEGALSIEASAAVPGGASALVPPNWDFVAYGDSRTENGLGATLGSSGYSTGSSNLGPAGYIPVATANRLKLARYPNYGISASTTTQGAAVPRMTATSTVTNSTPQTWYRGGDSTNKGADYAKNSGAGVVVILYGTNDQAGDLAGNSRNNILTILNNLNPGQLKIVYNECPKGYRSDGTLSAYSTSPAFKDYSAWLSTLDYASGSPNARADVIVVDLFGDAYDAATGFNKVGYLRDGLHFTPWGAKRAAALLHNRLTAVFGAAYTGLPSQAVLPVSNGASIAADTVGAHAPFVHTNPLLTPGTSGTVQGSNFGTAPTVATVPQGWAISGSGTFAGIAVSCDKTGTDGDGYPMWTVTVSGTLADQGSYLLQMYQNAQAAGQNIAITDKLRGVAKLAVGAGSQCLNYLRVRVSVIDSAGATRSQACFANGGSPGGTGDRIGYNLNSNGYDVGGPREVVLTQMIDLADANMSTANGGPGVLTAVGSQAFYIDAQFSNYTGATQPVSATIQISRAGAYKVS